MECWSGAVGDVWDVGRTGKVFGACPLVHITRQDATSLATITVLPQRGKIEPEQSERRPPATATGSCYRSKDWPCCRSSCGSCLRGVRSTGHVTRGRGGGLNIENWPKLHRYDNKTFFLSSRQRGMQCRVPCLGRQKNAYLHRNASDTGTYNPSAALTRFQTGG